MFFIESIQCSMTGIYKHGELIMSQSLTIYYYFKQYFLYDFVTLGLLLYCFFFQGNRYLLIISLLRCKRLSEYGRDINMQ